MAVSSIILLSWEHFKKLVFGSSKCRDNTSASPPPPFPWLGWAWLEASKWALERRKRKRFNFGQGFISIGIFELHQHLTVLTFKRRCRCGRMCGFHSDDLVRGEKGKKEKPNGLCTVNRGGTGSEEQPDMSSLCCNLRPK